MLTALGVALAVTGYRWIAAGQAPRPPRAGGLLVLLAIFPLVALILYSARPIPASCCRATWPWPRPTRCC